MPFLPRSPQSGASPQVSISKAYGALILAALLVLVLMRHVFGSIHAEGGIR
jgi:hypothetical protein